MRYLLVNHIPTAIGADPAHLMLPGAWARDLCAAARAARAAGITLIVATPVTRRPVLDGVEVVPDEAGFEHIALPHYDSARSFLHERSSLQAALTQAISLADIVQLDHGGYPVSLGHVADPIAKAQRRKTLWILGGDALPQSTLAQSAGTVAKRLVGRGVDQRLRKLLIDHLATAALVICCADSIRSQLAELKIDSTCIETLDVLDSEIEPQPGARAKRLVDPGHPLRFIVTGEQNIIAGTDHVLRAMHRCLRLRLPMELVILGDGVERDAILRQAQSLGIATRVRFGRDGTEMRSADVWVNAALTPAAEQDWSLPLARGLAPIVYRTHPVNEHVVRVPSGYVDGLAAAMSEAAIGREALAARMLAGVSHARTRTLDAACRRRFELAIALQGGRSRPAA